MPRFETYCISPYWHASAYGTSRRCFKLRWGRVSRRNRAWRVMARAEKSGRTDRWWYRLARRIALREVFSTLPEAFWRQLSEERAHEID